MCSEWIKVNLNNLSHILQNDEMKILLRCFWDYAMKKVNCKENVSNPALCFANVQDQSGSDPTVDVSFY